MGNFASNLNSNKTRRKQAQWSVLVLPTSFRRKNSGWNSLDESCFWSCYYNYGDCTAASCWATLFCFIFSLSLTLRQLPKLTNSSQLLSWLVYFFRFTRAQWQHSHFCRCLKSALAAPFVFGICCPCMTIFHSDLTFQAKILGHPIDLDLRKLRISIALRLKLITGVYHRRNHKLNPKLLSGVCFNTAQYRSCAGRLLSHVNFQCRSQWHPVGSGNFEGKHVICPGLNAMKLFP